MYKVYYEMSSEADTVVVTEVISDIALTAAPAYIAQVKTSSASVIGTIQWGSVTSILTAAFRIVPKIQELAKDISGAQKFDILVQVLDDGLVAWGDTDAGNAEKVAELRADLRDLLAPSVSAMINAAHAGDVSLGVQAAVSTVAAVAVVAAKGGWKCCSK